MSIRGMEISLHRSCFINQSSLSDTSGESIKAFDLDSMHIIVSQNTVESC
jgi:hypothetical protein